MYKNRSIIIGLGTAILLVLGSASSTFADTPDPNEVLGLGDVHTQSCMAIWVPLSSDQALSAVSWFNNDSTVSFPQLLATAGAEEGPGSLSDAIEVASQARGGNLQWSDWWLDQPVASEIDGLYLVFRLPEGSAYVEKGAGGGAAIGYFEVEDGPAVWLTLDGEEWFRLHENYTLAIEPEYTEALAGTPRLAPQLNKTLTVGPVDSGVQLETNLLPPTPNPFNPKVSLWFTLDKAEDIELSVYDLKGREVLKLAQGLFSAGPHVVEWLGQNKDGSAAASGLYLARLKSADRIFTQRMMLLR